MLRAGSIGSNWVGSVVVLGLSNLFDEFSLHLWIAITLHSATHLIIYLVSLPWRLIIDLIRRINRSWLRSAFLIALRLIL